MWPWWCPVYRWRELVAGAGMELENLSPRYRFIDAMRGTGADRPVVVMTVL